MNLLIEQRPTTITSKLQQQPSSSLSSCQNDVNSGLSSSPLVLKIKRQATKQQTDLNSPMVNDDNNNNNSRLQTTNQRLKRPISNSTTRRPSSPAFNGKQQATKRSVTIDNNNNDLTSNIDENSSTKRFKQDDLNQSSTSTKVDACVETVSIGLATEPDQLGPCEPGTSVVLEGIVWNETDSGVLVVNVTWRGKTYVGTLLDSTKQDWACPRLTCESPTSDYDPRSNNKTSRTKRGNAGGNNRSSNHYSFQQQITLPSGSDDRKLRNNIKSRQSKRLNETLTNNNNNNNNNSSPLTSPFPSNTTFFPLTNSETQLISCPELQCHKQFVSTIALTYHLSNAHKKPETISTVPIPQVSTRDEEDVAHILANVADYVRRPSPRSSPEHQRSTTLTWPCPQISSNLVLSSSLNNTEQTSIPLSTNSTRSILQKNETNIEQDDIKSTVKPADHFLLHIKDEPTVSSSSWTNTKIDRINENKTTLKIPTPPPPPSSFIPINLPSTIQPPPPISSSPAYSDISDEDPTTTVNETEQSSPSTINLLNEQTLIPNTPWTAEILLQYGSYMQQVNKELTSNCLNSKTDPNGTSDSTVKNILDSRRSLSSTTTTTTTTKPSSPPIPSATNDVLLNNYQKNLYPYQINDTSLSITSPNENLLNPSSSSIHPSR